MSTVLITGFEPFTTGLGLTLTENPTGAMAAAIAERIEGGISVVLPVSFQKTKVHLEALFAEHRPSIWLGLGYAPHRSQVDVEYVALNLEHAIRGDNDGVTPNLEPVCENAPNALFTRLPVQQIVAEMTRLGLPAQVGLHAGTFLCNQTFYLGCYEVEVAGRMSIAGFIHVPPSIDQSLLIQAIAGCLNELIEEKLRG
jgi:pyroglutamyl-peptidase